MIPGLLGTVSGGDPALILVVRTTVEPETFTFPRKAGEAYDCYVDWGDGSSTSHLQTVGGDSDAHSYAAAGDHVIKITGQCSALYFNNGDDKSKLLELRNWGDVQFTTLEHAFHGCGNLLITARDYKSSNTALVTNATYVFDQCTSLIWCPDLDISNVVNLSVAFAECSSLRAIPYLDTSSVTTMYYTFYGLSSVTSCPTFLMPNVSDFTGAFELSPIGTTSYSNILVWLAANNEKNNVTLGAGTNKYNAGAATARAHLVDDHGWTITDGGLET